MRSAFICAASFLLIHSTMADHSHNINEITVQAYPPVSQISTVSNSGSNKGLFAKPDSAELLRAIPGASFNSNGAITGIAQYRGLFGDRVAVSLDSSPALTGGPNAMGTPLSYAPASLLKELSVHRGIAPVSAAQESLGGHISAHFDRGSFNNGRRMQLSGFANSRYGDNGNQSASNLQLVAANKQHKVALLASYDEGDSGEAGDNLQLTGTQYQRSRTDLSYGLQSGVTNADFHIGQMDISNSGTPALAMDITSVETDLAGFNLSTEINDIKIFADLAWADVVHSMDNHSLRQPPMMTMGYRTNLATAENLSWTFKAVLPIDQASLTLGTDGNLADHNSVINNPENGMFQLVNFNQIERDSLGIFAELKGQLPNRWNYEAGLRFNQIDLLAGEVSAAGMMGSNASTLAAAFNTQDRDISHNNTDLVIKLSRALNASTSFNVDLGIKNRAPSYQELFLWLPLPITAGLADGRSYVGNTQLDSETAKEINLAISHNSGNFSIAPQIFYRRIDNYIQGTSTMNMTANMVSNMMSGAPALMHNNVDAEIYGLDANWNYSINDSWSVDGLFSYVRGKRTDIDDNLFRIAPANNRISLHYRPASLEQKLQLSIESQIYAKQSKVASFNGESATAGYGIINLTGQWSVSKTLQIQAGVANLFDRLVVNHLSGRNRAMGSDIALSAGIPDTGRNLYIALQINW